MINAARRPVLYVGGGVIQAQAGDLATALAEKASIPATMTLMGLGAIASKHPLALGMLGMHAARYTNLVLEECDLLIAAGVRFDDRATGKVAQFCPHSQVIHIDIDRSELDKIRTAHVGIHGDVGQVLQMLLPRVRTNSRPEWLARVAELKQQYPLFTPGAEDPQTPYGLILQTARMAGDDAIVTTDVGQHQMWTAQVYPFSRPRQLLTSGGLGTMGFGLPTAIGAALACPERTVICFSGDGSLLMNIQELVTAVEEDLNVKIVVMNNRSLGLVHQQQDLFFGKRYFASKFRADLDFVKIAAGFGMPACDLAASAEPIAMLKEAITRPGPCLIHARIDVSEFVFPIVPPGAANRDMLGGKTNVNTCI